MVTDVNTLSTNLGRTVTKMDRSVVEHCQVEMQVRKLMVMTKSDLKYTISILVACSMYLGANVN
jgi:hypothetical protein